MTTPADGAVEQYESEFEDAALALFAAEWLYIAALLDRLALSPVTDATVRAVLVSLVDDLESGALKAAWANQYTPLIERVSDAGAAPIRASIGSRFGSGFRTAAVTRAIDDRAAQLAEYVGKTTAEGILSAYRESRDAGEGAKQLATRIKRDVFDGDVTQARALTIARTEIGTAYNSGAYLTALGSGVLVAKSWLHSGNPRQPRDWHIDMDGETVGIEERFSNGLLHPCESGAPAEEVLNCGCSVAYRSQAELDRL